MQSEPHDPWAAPNAPVETRIHCVAEQVERFLGFIVHEPSEELSEISDANKRKLCGEILSDVQENVGHPDPVLAVRRRLTNYATLTAYDQVLTRTPRQSEFAAITGELRPRLPELARINPLLREFLCGEPGAPGTVDQMAERLRARAIVYNMWARAYNVARIELGDWDKDKRKDWFGAYKVAQGVFCEFAYRRELTMPPNIRSAETQTDGSAEFAAYGEFEKLILDGHRQPRRVWEERWESLLHYPCPLRGLEL
jgi:hypothetical protein